MIPEPVSGLDAGMSPASLIGKLHRVVWIIPYLYNLVMQVYRRH